MDMIDIAFTTLVREAAAPLERSLARWTGSRDAAPDLAQETFLRAYRGRERLRDPARARGWLFAIGRQVAVDWLRREGRRGAAPLGAHEPAASAGPLETEARRAIVEAVSSLEPDLRAVVELRYDASLTYDEIGAVEGVPASTVQSRLRAARRALAARLSERAPELVPALLGGAAAGALALEGGGGGGEEIAAALSARAATPGLAERALAACEAVASASAPPRAPAARAGDVSGLVSGVAAGLAALLALGLVASREGGAGPAPVALAAQAGGGGEVASAPPAPPVSAGVPGGAPSPEPAALPRAATAATTATPGAATPLPPSVEVLSATTDRLLGTRRLTLQLSEVALSEALLFFEDLTGLEVRAEIEGEQPAPAPAPDRAMRRLSRTQRIQASGRDGRVWVRVSDVAAGAVVDLLALCSRTEASVDAQGAVAIRLAEESARPSARLRSPLERALLATAAQPSLDARSEVRTEGAATLWECLEKVADALPAGGGVALVTPSLAETPAPAPVVAESPAAAVEAIARAAGLDLSWRILDGIVLVGREADMPAEARRPSDPPPAPEGGAPVLLPPLRDPTPRALAGALAADGRPVQVDEAVLDGGPLPLALSGEATPGDIGAALALTAAEATVVSSDGVIVIVDARSRADRRRRSVGLFDATGARAGAAAKAWADARRARHDALAAGVLRHLRDLESGQPLSARLAAAAVLERERQEIAAGMRGPLAGAVRALPDVLDARDAPDPTAALARAAEALGVAQRRWTTAPEEERAAIADEIQTATQDRAALLATQRLRALAARWRDALDRHAAGASPEEIFRGDEERFCREVREARD